MCVVGCCLSSCPGAVAFSLCLGSFSGAPDARCCPTDVGFLHPGLTLLPPQSLLQAVEPSTLVPLAHGGAKQVYLVGDPVQLPATVMSQVRL